MDSLKSNKNKNLIRTLRWVLLAHNIHRNVKFSAQCSWFPDFKKVSFYVSPSHLSCSSTLELEWYAMKLFPSNSTYISSLHCVCMPYFIPNKSFGSIATRRPWLNNGLLTFYGTLVARALFPWNILQSRCSTSDLRLRSMMCQYVGTSEVFKFVNYDFCVS